MTTASQRLGFRLRHVLAMVLAACSLAAQAKGSSHPQAAEPSTGGMVPIEAAQRAITFPTYRHWSDTEGRILFCPFDAEATHKMQCLDKKTEANRWLPITSLKIAGFELAGFQYTFVGSSGSQVLIVYYRAVRPAEPAVKVGIVRTDVLNYCATRPADPKVKSVAAPTDFIPTVVNFACPVTIRADKVIVERRLPCSLTSSPA